MNKPREDGTSWSRPASMLYIFSRKIISMKLLMLVLRDPLVLQATPSMSLPLQVAPLISNLKSTSLQTLSYL